MYNSMENVKIFAQTIEYGVYEQIKNLSNYEAYKDSKIRLMPDCHVGKGCTVGTTMSITDKVTPNLVGVDIGCGMLVVELKCDNISNEMLEKFDYVINNYIPHGHSIHTSPKYKLNFDSLRCGKFVDTRRALYSIGSLGGGNHFIECAKGENNGRYYLIIHSGSRKLGADVCKYYQDLAIKNLNDVSFNKNTIINNLKAEGREKEIASTLKNYKKPSCNKELAHLEGRLFDDYIADMQFTQNYASLNRHVMANIILLGIGIGEVSRIETIHNYIDFNRMILRKGAVSAEMGETLLIPINMRDGSLLCIGKGNDDWNYSAPHGAGRLYSRSEAKKHCTLDDYKTMMNGIYSTSITENTIDENPNAYKNINEIINCIEPTVDIIDILKPIYNFKAH